ncbi:unnamed protein product [Cyprideis torosa]|uniref:Uncharacterized protein n=1 Tax=Cyprideis torosa TaxID=163714 RepID=A0A7R8WPE7_9CRUS|nr:unnamed protein product [Cyprideis torosa]CAG0900664.1 unnamed protein product [Cyprideis torosa]
MCLLCPASFIAAVALSKFKGCFAKISPQRLIEMADTKVDIEEPSLEPPRREFETAVKEEAAEATDETDNTGHQRSRRTKRKSKKTKKEPVHYDCAVCGRRFKGRSHLKNHERVHSGTALFLTVDGIPSFKVLILCDSAELWDNGPAR